jgi:hypothetical protein
MTHRIGQILRGVGLLIELLGVTAVVAQPRANEAARIPLPGGTSVALGWLAVGAGFLIWLAGRIMIAGSLQSRLSRKRIEARDRDLD